METFEDLLVRLEAAIIRVEGLHQELVKVIEQDTTDRKGQEKALDDFIARWKAGVHAED